MLKKYLVLKNTWKNLNIVEWRHFPTETVAHWTRRPWWKTITDKLKTISNGRQPSMQDDLIWKMTSNRRQDKLQSNLEWKTTSNKRCPQVENYKKSSKEIECCRPLLIKVLFQDVWLRASTGRSGEYWWIGQPCFSDTTLKKCLDEAKVDMIDCSGAWEYLSYQ